MNRSTSLKTEGLFSPTASWKGASARIKRILQYPLEEQNFITMDDYQEYGPDILQDFVVG